MITYTYACGGCTHVFDALVESDADRPGCPMCRSKNTRASPVCSPSIRTSNKRRRRVFDMSSGSCPCGCANRKARAEAVAV
ncbi:MAG: hypothetical protein IT538_15730 [Variibacter sp.]|nr:hypothetical protein [Variibacter sp.]